MVRVIIRVFNRSPKYRCRKELKKAYSEPSRSLVISKNFDRLPKHSTSYEIN